MNREYSLYKTKKANCVLNTAFTFLVLLSIIILLIGSLLIINISKKNGMHNILYYVIIMFIVIFDQFIKYFIDYYRLKEELTNINKIELVSNVFSFLFILVFIKKYQIYAVLIGMLISSIITVFFAFSKSRDIRLKINKPILIELIKVGIPLLIYNLGYYIMSTVDRFIIIKYLGSVDLGYYTFANQISSATLIFLQSILFLNYNSYIKKLNKKNLESSEEAIRIVRESEEKIQILGGGLIIVGSITIYPFVNIIMDQYESAINIYRFLVISVVFYKLSSYANIYIISNKRQELLIFFQFITIIVGIILNILFIKLGYGINGICIATVIVNILYSIMQTLAFLFLNKSKDKARVVFKMYIKIIVISIIIFILAINKANIFIFSIIILLSYIFLYIKKIKEILKSII